MSSYRLTAIVAPHGGNFKSLRIPSAVTGTCYHISLFLSYLFTVFSSQLNTQHLYDEKLGYREFPGIQQRLLQFLAHSQYFLLRVSRYLFEFRIFYISNYLHSSLQKELSWNCYYCRKLVFDDSFKCSQNTLDLDSDKYQFCKKNSIEKAYSQADRRVDVFPWYSSRYFQSRDRLHVKISDGLAPSGTSRRPFFLRVYRAPFFEISAPQRSPEGIRSMLEDIVKQRPAKIRPGSKRSSSFSTWQPLLIAGLIVLLRRLYF